MDLDTLKPALEAGMTRQLDEIDTIASNPDPQTFENTIVALKCGGRDLDRVSTYLGVWSSNVSTPEFREIQREMAPRLAEFGSKITQNAALFTRIMAVYDGGEMASLRPDQQRLVWLTYDDVARNGATLDGEAKARYAAIEQRLAGLHTRFSNNVLADEEAYVTHLAVRRYRRRIDWMTTGSFGTVLVTAVPAILSTTAVPSITRPKTA